MSKAVNKTEFFAWLRRTEGPRLIKQWTSPASPAIVVYASCNLVKSAILSAHRSDTTANLACYKYRRWLTEFEETENTKGTCDET